MPTGRFAFVELRTEELATTAMTMDKTELLGRPMNIGRPKGYVPGTSGPGETHAQGTCMYMSPVRYEVIAVAAVSIQSNSLRLFGQTEFVGAWRPDTGCSSSSWH